jgi:hypothetical protein
MLEPAGDPRYAITDSLRRDITRTRATIVDVELVTVLREGKEQKFNVTW